MIYATANGAHATSTKCARMQKDEENPKKKDVPNGNGDCAAGSGERDRDREDAPRSAYAHGGRLKFFKDGKFILELERSREGERVSWVSVPRKTFWPPQGTASSTPTYRQESSTSLSVSDDNSSIQSSPWQRDHSWKQTSPRKNLSKQLAFFYLANRKLRRTLRRSKKTRKPHDPAAEDFARSSPASPRPAANAKRKEKKEKRLQSIIQALAEKVPAGSPVRETAVSPRKRILREMDKDAKTHVEDACLKRSRGKPAGRAVGSPVRTNGAAATPADLGEPHPPPPASTPSAARQTQPRNSSYSITSLLADDKSIRRSPANSPSHYSPGAAAAVAGGHPYSTPTPEERWYAESVDRLRSIELSHVDKRLCLPYATPPPYMPPFMHPYTLPPHYFHAFARSFPGLTAAPPACLLPPPVRTEAPSCSWAAEPPRDSRTQDDNIADMPLNLSKHAG